MSTSPLIDNREKPRATETIPKFIVDYLLTSEKSSVLNTIFGPKKSEPIIYNKRKNSNKGKRSKLNESESNIPKSNIGIMNRKRQMKMMLKKTSPSRNQSLCKFRIILVPKSGVTPKLRESSKDFYTKSQEEGIFYKSGKLMKLRKRRDNSERLSHNLKNQGGPLNIFDKKMRRKQSIRKNDSDILNSKYNNHNSPNHRLIKKPLKGDKINFFSASRSTTKLKISNNSEIRSIRPLQVQSAKNSTQSSKIDSKFNQSKPAVELNEFITQVGKGELYLILADIEEGITRLNKKLKSRFDSNKKSHKESKKSSRGQKIIDNNSDIFERKSSLMRIKTLKKGINVSEFNNKGYYISDILKYRKKGSNYFGKLFNDHFKHTIMSLQFSNNIKDISSSVLKRKRVKLPKLQSSGKIQFYSLSN